MAAENADEFLTMKYFMIGGDKREYGPFEAEQIRQFLRENRANGETLLRLEGETDWKPLRAFTELQVEGGPPPIPNWATTQSTRLEARDTTISVGHSFARAWHLVSDHFGAVFGATFLVWLAFTASMYAPCFGMLAMLFYGPLFGGLYMFFLKLIREGDAAPGDVFALSANSAMPLMITGLFSLILVQLGTIACILPGIYLFIAWLFCLPLVADRGLTFWDALETSRRAATRHWFKIFALFILAFLPFMGFHLYLRARETIDMMPHFEKLIAMFPQIFSGAPPNHAEMQRISRDVAEVQAGYGGWRLFRQFLLLISLPYGIASLAYVYEDLFGPKK
jgi:hypothetical protein